MKTFVVTAYRWGQRNAHSYVVGAFESFDAAKACADAHVDYRGGKYGCEVVEAKLWSEVKGDVAKQVYYAESPYYGRAGDAGHFHPADLKKGREPSLKPFTVRELQNLLNESRRVLRDLSDRVNTGYDFNADPDNMTLRVGNALRSHS